ncbi:hypothetical protein TNCV_568031 [Trichonephila clavipes]|nr:hypothetical protein TNCV_568031 [Trichonephila clavipes]
MVGEAVSLHSLLANRNCKIYRQNFEADDFPSGAVVLYKASVSETNEKSPAPRGKVGGKGGEPIREAGRRGQRSAEEEMVIRTGAIEKSAKEMQ